MSFTVCTKEKWECEKGRCVCVTKLQKGCKRQQKMMMLMTEMVLSLNLT